MTLFFHGFGPLSDSLFIRLHSYLVRVCVNAHRVWEYEAESLVEPWNADKSIPSTTHSLPK